MTGGQRTDRDASARQTAPSLQHPLRRSSDRFDLNRIVAGGSEMSTLIRSKNWSKTSVGAIEAWPQSLRTTVSMMLESRFAMVVAWGPEFTFFYNDRYRPILGATKHPYALGAPARQVFPEAWPFIGPLFHRTRVGESVALDDQLIPLDRNGYLENCYFTLSYSPIRNESGGVGGMLGVVAETTERVQAERRFATLRDLLRAAAEAKSVETACENATGIFDKNDVDVPFALLYLVEQHGQRARLVSTSGLNPGMPACPREIELAADEPRAWPVARAMGSRKLALVTDLPSRFDGLPGGPYLEPAHTAVIMPLAKPGQQHPEAIFIAGASPRRAFDDAYQGFFELAADHILTAITNARAFQCERGRAERLADIGVGIAPHELPHVFERFHRIEGTRARTHEGSGIGLAMVQELVTLLGGTISAHSSFGTGTTFTVTLPRGSNHLPSERIQTARPVTSSSSSAGAFVEEALRWLPERECPDAPQVTDVSANAAHGSSTARILVADDNADMRAYLRRLLEPDFVVELVDDGTKALASACARPPDLVVTDVMMPGLNGFELIRKLRAHEATRTIPVVVLSARAGEEAKVHGLAEGADDYVTKPFSACELVARVRSQLQLGQLRRAAETAQRLARAQQERSIEELQRVVRFSEMFIGILGHDLRNPLSAISVAANLLGHRAESEKVATPVSRILTSVRRMDRMISQLLEFAQIRLGRGIALDRAPIDVLDVCQSVIDELNTWCNADIVLESVGDLRGIWDRDHVTQLVSNLVTNACQHGTPGTGIQVDLDGCDDELVRLQVKNQGAIPAGLLPVIFDPLLRIEKHPDKPRRSSGLGLGLYITREIVIAHGGTIRVESGEATGTTFVVDLPRRT